MKMSETKEAGESRGSRGRYCFLDILRVAATCAVVLMHTLTGAVDAVDISLYPAERLVYLVVMDLITWCVPVFVLISGYLFLNPDKPITFLQMLKKYCRRILLALFLFGIPYAMLELLLVEKTFRFSMLGQSIWLVLQGKSWSHMWYLYLILLLYLLTPAMKWLLSGIPVTLLYGILAVLLVGSSIFPFFNKLLQMELPVLPDGGIYFFYYLCGYLFARRDAREKQSRHSGPYPVTTVLILILCLGMVLSRVSRGFSLQMAYNYPFTVMLALLLFETARRSKIEPGEKIGTFWQTAGSLCFTIYLVHPVFINLLYKFFHISLLDYPIGISLPVFFVGVLFLATLSAWILRKIPVLKKYVL